ISRAVSRPVRNSLSPVSYTFRLRSFSLSVSRSGRPCNMYLKLSAYAAYLFFQNKTHVRLFEDNATNSPPSTAYPSPPANSVIPMSNSSATISESRREDTAEAGEEQPQLCLSVVIGLLILLTGVRFLSTSNWSPLTVGG